MKEPAAEEEVLRDYLAYYAGRGAEGELAVCDEVSLKARARRLLGPRRCGALDVCSVAERCRRARGERDGSSVFRDLLKALEVLELLCVNLLLSPWRKEIRSLKVGKRCGGVGGGGRPGSGPGGRGLSKPLPRACGEGGTAAAPAARGVRSSAAEPILKGLGVP